MTILDALKSLAVVMGCASSVDDVNAATISECLDFMAKNYPG